MRIIKTIRAIFFYHNKALWVVNFLIHDEATETWFFTGAATALAISCLCAGMVVASPKIEQRALFEELSMPFFGEPAIWPASLLASAGMVFLLDQGIAAQ